MIELMFITGNVGKVEELGRHLGHPVAHKKLDLPEIQSLSLREIVEEKAKEAHKEMGGLVLVEDASLVFNALGKLPGPLVKWFYSELDTSGLCKLLDGYEDRSAVAECMFGLYDGETLHVFEGAIEGVVANAPRGERAFGWGSIFIPKGYTKTWGEMDDEEQKETSMRRIALKKLETHLLKSI